MALKFVVFLALCIGFCYCNPSIDFTRVDAKLQQTRPTDLRMNNLVNPVGIGTAKPEFNWRLSAEFGTTNVTQTAYEIEVFESSESNQTTRVWHSGKVVSNQQFEVVYDGKTLKERHPYYRRLRIWNQTNQTNENDWTDSKDNWFETGILDPMSWKAQWISPQGSGGSTDETVIYLRGALNLSDTPVRGRAYSSALGWYKLFVNGYSVTGSALVPRWTPFDHYIEYQTYDITPYLRTGENVISIAVGDGRYRGWLGLTDGRNRYGDRLAAFSQLEIDLDDGISVKFVTDSKWTSHDGHVLRSDSRYCEHSDLRILDGTWLGTSRASARPVEVLNSQSHLLIAEEVERVEETMHLKPISIRRSSFEKQIIDFGQNFAGSARIRMRGPEGAKITLTYSEVLGKDGNINTNYLFPPFSLAPS